MLHNQNQLPRLPRIAQIVMIPGVVVWCGVVFLTNNNTTPTKVVLSCFGLLVGLWQLEAMLKICFRSCRIEIGNDILP